MNKNDRDLLSVTCKYVCNIEQINKSRLKIGGMITQLNAFVNTRGTVYQKELILLCVNYCSKREDYKIFTEGSNVCMCVRACVCGSERLNANSDYSIKMLCILFFFLLNCLLNFFSAE